MYLDKVQRRVAILGQDIIRQASERRARTAPSECHGATEQRPRSEGEGARRARRAPKATERSGRSEGAERPERGREALGAPGESVPQAILKHVRSAASSSSLRCINYIICILYTVQRRVVVLAQIEIKLT